MYLWDENKRFNSPAGLPIKVPHHADEVPGLIK